MSSNDTTPQKTCTKCGQTFPLTTEFFRFRASRNSWELPCKKCMSEYSRRYNEKNKDVIQKKKRAYKQANKEHFRELDRQYRETHQNEIKAYKREYQVTNKERLNQISRENSRRERLETPDVIKARKKKWWQNNLVKALQQGRVAANIRRARRRQLPDTFTVEQWQACLEYFNYCCAVCGNQLRDLFGNIEPHTDHWIPISYEGDDNPGTVATNMVCLCNGCNLSKNATMPDVWLTSKYGKRKANEILSRIETYFKRVQDS